MRIWATVWALLVTVLTIFIAGCFVVGIFEPSIVNLALLGCIAVNAVISVVIAFKEFNR